MSLIVLVAKCSILVLEEEDCEMTLRYYDDRKLERTRTIVTNKFFLKIHYLRVLFGN